MKHTYRTKGTCSVQIDFDLSDDGVLSNVIYTGGCNGNLQGISKLVEGRKAQDVIQTLKGIRCGYKETSCPDQLARALETACKKQFH